jgi:4-nitrophenyl phosphatase
MATVTPPVHTVLCDLDGVVWLAGQAIPGAPEAVARLRAAGCRVLFVTNNSAALIAEQQAALAAIGVPADGDVLTSAWAAATLLAPGQRVLVCGGPGVVEACTAAGAHVVSEAPCDVVVVGFHRDFDYERLRVAADAIRRGARLVGTNDDPTYPTPAGPIPGGGAILAAVSVASGATPEIAGKPHRPMAELVRRTVGTGFDPDATVMIGDRPSTDGLFARVIGCRYAIVRTGVTAPGHPVEVDAWLDAGDLAAVADVIVDGDGPGSDSHRPG